MNFNQPNREFPIWEYQLDDNFCHDFRTFFNKTNLINKNRDLAGNIKNEYECNLFIPRLEKMIKDAKAHLNQDFRLDSLWVNLMYKHEFNPLHHHDGKYSFVIFIDVPITNENQKNAPGAEAKNNLAGTLSFLLPINLNAFRTLHYKPDQQIINKCIFFPSNLGHIVYPFYNIDKPRITLAGNVI